MIAEAFLDVFLEFRPVHATFMGLPGYDALLPRADARVVDDERVAWINLAALLDAAAAPVTAAERLDLRIARAETAIAQAELERRPRQRNPAWATGEVLFGVIGLLLKPGGNIDAVALRLAAIPDFLADALTWLDGPTPHGWVARALCEAEAAAAFFETGLLLHPQFRAEWSAPAQSAATMLRRFAAAIATLDDAGFACGEAHLELLMRTAHGIDLSPAAALAKATAAFAQLGDELDEMGRRIDPSTPWQSQIDALANLCPSRSETMDAYRRLNQNALHGGGTLVTPCTEYGLTFQPLLPAFADIAKASYFLSYRCPPAGNPESGSIYWVAAPISSDPAALRAHNFAAVKTTHAVHHGSIGHHTQNGRARAAPSRLAQLGGTDCAAAIAFLSAGTMVEGWACHAVDLMAEVPGFYTDAEKLLVKHGERRNAASVIADIRLHTGAWTQDDAIRFYRDKAGFPAARVAGEVVRNSMFPASRLMYWYGVEAIRALRRAWAGDSRDFHDTLIGHGHIPIAWVADEIILK